MNTGMLRKRIDRVLASIERPACYSARDLDYSLFTDSEREKYLEILYSLPEGSFGDDIPPKRLFYFSLYMRLYKALQEGDEPRITGYRYRLSFTDEQIIDMFISLSDHGETNDELHRFTPYGIVYSCVRENLLHAENDEGDELDKATKRQRRVHRYRYIDEAWNWLVNAGLVESLYHSDLEFQIEYPHADRFPHARRKIA